MAESIEIVFPKTEENSDSEKSLQTGKTIALEVKILPENTTDKAVEWSVDNTELAEIDTSGSLTAKKAGKVTVTAKTSNGISDEISIDIYSNDWIYAFSIIGVSVAAVLIYYKKKKVKNIIE